MKHLLQITIASCMFMLFSNTTTLHAQLFVDDSFDAETMVLDFFDSQQQALMIENITFTGADGSMGFFEGSECNVGLNAGILMTTGTIENAIGPNNQGLQTGHNQTNGDSDLDAIEGVLGTNDACILEFDIVPFVDSLVFHYVFASEEYLEFVDSFNDVFAFFVSGPGYTENTNIALIPNTDIEVSINNINADDYSQYYVNNGNGSSAPQDTDATVVQYDGFTTPLTAVMHVVAGETYHIKLAIADDSDSALDSGVFLSVESLGGSPQLATISDFSAETTVADGLTVSFQNEARYGTDWLWDFGDGNTFEGRYPEPHTYATAGVYTVSLTTSNYCCSTTESFEVGVGGVQVGINENASYDFNYATFMVYPNPTDGQIQIILPNSDESTISLYDVAGKLVHQEKVFGQLNMNLDAFGKGIYWVNVRSNEDVYTQKIVNF
ncbi:MAG: choice-of-anchor L domain-containing protein [Chitinophagales bacterium]